MKKIDEWLTSEIENGRVHPEYRRIYYWVLENFKKYEEQYNQEKSDIGQTEKIKEFPCQECGAKKTIHFKTCSHFKPMLRKPKKDVIEKNITS